MTKITESYLNSLKDNPLVDVVRNQRAELVELQKRLKKAEQRELDASREISQLRFDLSVAQSTGARSRYV